jgi:tetratricopeptide (TPR) repeat protein
MMTRLTTTLGLAVALAASSPVAAQPPPPAARTGMYEDVETLRQILAQKLHPYAVVHAPNVNTLMYPDSNAQFFQSHLTGQFYQSNLPNQLGAGSMNPYAQFPNSIGYSANAVSVASTTFLEGNYLKGQGVVYTVTLAPPGRDPRPQPAAAPPKPVSDWDRTRRELRGDPPPPSTAKPPTREPSVADVILKALAENGHHFGNLGDGESLTVIVTFRDPYHPPGARRQHSGTEPAARPPENKAAAPSSARDYELLGDLHLKQGKPDEAIKAYLKGTEQKPDAKQLADLHAKLASAYQVLAGGDAKNHDAAMLRALEFLRLHQADENRMRDLSNTQFALQALAQAGAAAPKPAVRLPAKLVVTAPKRALEQVGSGQLSFVEFQKAVTVEYLNFDPADAPAEKGGKE